MINHRLITPILVGLIGSISYSLFSYSLTDPNLTISSHPIFMQFQSWMWELGQDPTRVVMCYLFCLMLLWSAYLLLLHQTRLKSLNWRDLLTVFTIWTLPLLFSYNALSHDVFNYMFNAKMVLVYGANPHIQVAQNFSSDPWLRFMHNVHTPAPYWYGWTVLSLVPAIIGGGKFLLTWLSFRFWSLIPLLLLVWWYWHLSKLKKSAVSLHQITLVLLNPLLLIEVVSNSHNDLWMMLPAVMAMTSLLIYPKSRWILISSFVWLISVSTKLASLVLAPILGGLVWMRLRYKQRELNLSAVAGIALLLMTLPLFLPRSQQFHPWYATWLLVWLPFLFGRWKYWLMPLVLAFTITSMLRYLPWMWSGYSEVVYDQQRLITWAAIPLTFFWLGVNYTWKRR